VQNNIKKKSFIKIKKWNTLELNSLFPVESPLWAQKPTKSAPRDFPYRNREKYTLA